MTLEEEAAYKRLMSYQFDSGYVPSDIQELAKICKNVTPKKMAAMWVRLAPCFVQNGTPGHLINPRMDEIRRERMEFKENRSKAGIAGNERKRFLREHSASAKDTHSDTQSDTQNERTANAQRTQTLRSSSPSPSPSQEREIKRERETPIAPKKARVPSGGLLRFPEFWKIYPSKVGKGAAEQSWVRQRLDSIADEVIKAVHVQRSCQKWLKDNGEFIPNPTTWLNQKRWKDEPVNVGAAYDPGSIERPSQEPHPMHFCQFCGENGHEWQCSDPAICGIPKTSSCPEFAARYDK